MDTIAPSHLATGRAVDQLRRQLGIVLVEASGNRIGACPIEGVTPALLTQLPKQRQLLLTGARARSLGLKTDAKLVSIDARSLTLPTLQALADPLSDAGALPTLTLLAVTQSHAILLSMAKYASLLPALLIVENAGLPADWLQVSSADIAAYWAAPPLDMVPLAEAQLPIEGAEAARLICFRMRYGTSVHLALIVGTPADNALTRIHSSCVTGDILGSLRCDCGDQLKLALSTITAEGTGILLYLHQEGRGIGIANKLRAYKLQERGVDTYEANAMLGFDEDERDFSIAGAILKKLGVQQIRLLTNNPGKLAAIEKSGIKVSQRVPLIAPSGKHNHGYLETKVKKAGHLF